MIFHIWHVQYLNKVQNERLPIGNREMGLWHKEGRSDGGRGGKGHCYMVCTCIRTLHGLFPSYITNMSKIYDTSCIYTYKHTYEVVQEMPGWRGRGREARELN